MTSCLFVSLSRRSLKKLGSPSEKVVKLRETLVWQMFWESRHHCTVNNNMKDFISIMLDLVQTATSNEVCVTFGGFREKMKINILQKFILFFIYFRIFVHIVIKMNCLRCCMHFSSSFFLSESSIS